MVRLVGSDDGLGLTKLGSCVILLKLEMYFSECGVEERKNKRCMADACEISQGCER